MASQRLLVAERVVTDGTYVRWFGGWREVDPGCMVRLLLNHSGEVVGGLSGGDLMRLGDWRHLGLYRCVRMLWLMHRLHTRHGADWHMSHRWRLRLGLLDMKLRLVHGLRGCLRSRVLL